MQIHVSHFAFEADPFAEALQKAGADQRCDHDNDKHDRNDEVLVRGLNLQCKGEGNHSSYQS